VSETIAHVQSFSKATPIASTMSRSFPISNTFKPTTPREVASKDPEEDHTQSPPSEGADLRRARNKQFAEILVARAQWLSPPDAALVRATFGQGSTVAQVARLARTDARSLRRRLRRLVRRLSSREFLVVLRAWEHWAPTRRRVARACFIDGLSQRQACKALKLSLHTIRRHSSAVKALAETEPFRKAS
jgi:DNA-directed RNA polymerase specialized sigma24 family protein